MTVSACLTISYAPVPWRLSIVLTKQREGGGDVAGAEPHCAAIGGLGLGLPQRREGGGDVAGAEPHCAAIGGLGLGLPQRREGGSDVAGAEPHCAAVGWSRGDELGGGGGLLLVAGRRDTGRDCYYTIDYK